MCVQRRLGFGPCIHAVCPHLSSAFSNRQTLGNNRPDVPLAASRSSLCMNASPFYPSWTLARHARSSRYWSLEFFPLPLFFASCIFFQVFFSYCSAKEEKASQKCRMRCVCLIRCAEAGDPDRSIRVRAAPGHECTPKQWFVLACSKIFFKKN